MKTKVTFSAGTLQLDKKQDLMMNVYFLLATLCMSALHCEADFLEDIEKAKKENDQYFFFEPVGCFKDRSRSPRPALGRLLITDRDRTSKLYSGEDIDWLNFGVYLEDFAYRCAKEASKKGFTVFGLQFYGECWGGLNAGDTFAMYGHSKNCANEFYGECEENERICIGRANANFVYAISEPLSPPPASGSGSGESLLLT